jgi:hypothetical protein
MVHMVTTVIKTSEPSYENNNIIFFSICINLYALLVFFSLFRQMQAEHNEIVDEWLH